jgi:hypothetical protein
MEYLELLFPIFMAILAIFVAFFAVVFLFRQQRWFQSRHGDSGDTLQQKEETLILPPFWASRLTAWFVFAESKFWKKGGGFSAAVF